MKKEISVEKLIEKFTGMTERGSLLARGSVRQEDLLIQIKGVIAEVAMEEG